MARRGLGRRRQWGRVLNEERTKQITGREQAPGQKEQQARRSRGGHLPGVLKDPQGAQGGWSRDRREVRTSASGSTEVHCDDFGFYSE